MNRGVVGERCTAAVMLIALAACSSTGGELAIRPTKSALAPGELPVPYRVAEARAHFRLGNVALALEGFRKALRENPNSVDALNGMAACYDRMGRFDLSRQQYEQALAIAPGDARLYVNLATSLDLQGRVEEAAAVRREIKQRFASAAVDPGASPASPPAPPPAFPEMPMTPPSLAEQSLHVPAPQVAIAIPDLGRTEAPTPSDPRPADQARLVPPGFSEASSQRPADSNYASARLERLSLGEVALVTAARPLWKARVVGRTGRSTTIAFAKQPQRPNPAQAVVLLNAARIEGLAARTRSRLAAQGWRRVAIGNASRAQRQSMILYPTECRVLAERLSRQFGFAMRQQETSRGQIVVLLGRDVATDARQAGRRT